MSEPVWITGVGLVSALGVDAPTTWEALLAGRRGVRIQPLAEGTRVRVRAARVRSFDPRPLLRQRRTLKLMAPDARYALAASAQALAQAGLADPQTRPEGMPLAVAASADTVTLSAQIEGLEGILERSDARRVTLKRFFETMAEVNPLDAVRLGTNMVAAHLSINLELDGDPLVLGPGPDAGGAAIGEAFREVASGAQPVVLVGAGDDLANVGLAELLGRLGYAFPDRAPAELEHGVVLPGGGAAFLVLEAASHARSRGAAPVARLVAWSGPAPTHRAAIASVLDAGDRNAGRLGFVHLDSGAGRGVAPEEEALRDARETAGGALRATSTRGAVGHLGAAAPAFDLATSALAVRARRLPPLPRGWGRGLERLRPARRGERLASRTAGLLSAGWMGGGVYAGLVEAAS